MTGGRLKRMESFVYKEDFMFTYGDGISDVDLVILCTPMSEYESIIPYLNKFLDKKSIITDVGSTKQNVLRLKNKKMII